MHDPERAPPAATVDYAGRSWRWQQTITDPGIAGIRRLDVRVAPQATTGETPAASTEEDFPALATAYGFLGTAVAPGNGNDPDWSLTAAQAPPAGPGGPAGPGSPGAGTGTPAPGTGAPATGRE